MKKAIQVKIPTPCHEDWGKMTPTEKGRHCTSCEKEVTDFTQKSDEQVFKILKANPNSCGRFKKSQLDRDIKLERKTTAALAPYAASLLLPLTLLGSLNSKATSKEVKTENVFNSIGIGRYSKKGNQNKGKTITVGVVTDSKGQPLNNVKITSNETAVVVYTNNKGVYEITCFHGEMLTFERFEFETFNVVTTGIKNTKNITLISIKSHIELMPLGKFIIQPEQLPEEDMGEMVIEEDKKKQEINKATTKIISGTVTDNSGLPLPGVNVIIKGTTNGTQTDFDGLYRLNVEQGQTVVYTYVGFEKFQKIISASTRTLNITLEAGENWMGEVVITGGYIANEPDHATATRPFGKVYFANDPEREAARRKQKEAYEVTKQFQRRKLREKKEARKLKRQGNRKERAKKKKKDLENK